MEKEFNLLDEPWIRVIDSGCAVHELSLGELFAHAHEYADLCGELQTQDVAVLRLLLAVLHTIFSRYDASGQEAPLLDTDDALDRWQELWNGKRFPEKVINDYLEQWRERFWLFHPEQPFWQVEKASGGTEYGASKLNGVLSESSNKVRLFPMVSGGGKETVSNAEAARWLLYVNAFDDTSAKPSSEARASGTKLPSTGAGWLGKLGLITVSGDNLFETLMLNLILRDHRGDKLWSREQPVWELQAMPSQERREIPMPDNLSKLYTLQSRRLILKRGDRGVCGYYLLGGDFFEKENASIEPMTVWSKKKDSKTEIYTPRRHDASKQFWRDFANVFPQSDETHWQPGVLRWFSVLQEEKLLENRRLRVKIASVQYGDKDFFVTNVFADSLTMSAKMLDKLERPWQTAVINSIGFIDDIAGKVWRLAHNIALATGGDGQNRANSAKAQYYYRIDEPFRRWLESLPSDLGTDKAEALWQKQALAVADSLGSELVEAAGIPALTGRTITEKDTKKVVRYSSAIAMNSFRASLAKYRKAIKTVEGGGQV